MEPHRQPSAATHEEASLDAATQAAFWHNRLASIVSDGETGLIMYVNEAYCDLVGRPRHELEGKTSSEAGVWNDASDRRAVESYFNGEPGNGQFELRLRRPNGEVRVALSSISAFRQDGCFRFASQLIDITERKRTEGRLRLLDRIARLGWESTSADEMLDGTLGALHDIFPDARASFGWVNDSPALDFVRSVGPSTMPDITGVRVDLGQAKEYAAALHEGIPFVVPDVEIDPRFHSMAASLTGGLVRSFVDVPVRRNDVTIGLLALDSSDVRQWRGDEVAILTDAATQLALALVRVEAEKALRLERELLQTVIDHVPDFLYIKDRNSRFTRVNRASADFFGVATPADAIGKSDYDFFPEQLARAFFEGEQEVMRSGIARINELEPQNSDRTQWALTTTVPVLGPDGDVTGIVGTSRDVTEIRVMEQSLHESEVRRKALLDAIPDLVFRFDRDGKYLDFLANQAPILGFDPAQTIGQYIHDVLQPFQAETLLGAIRQALDTGEVVTVEYESPNGTGVCFQEARIAPCGDSEVVSVARDVTERKLMEQRLAHQATHDPLTGIPNRALFMNRLLGAVDLAARQNTQIAVLYIDLDDFKLVNDRLGHDAGDRMLAAVAERLKRTIRGGDTVARIGGDEFAVILEGITAMHEAEIVAHRILERLIAPIRLGTSAMPIGASIGIAIGRPERAAVDSLLIDADRAMYEAKRSGKNMLAYVDATLGPVLIDRKPFRANGSGAVVRALPSPEAVAVAPIPAEVRPLIGPRRGAATTRRRPAG